MATEQEKEANLRALELLVGGLMLSQPKPMPIILRSDLERWQKEVRK